MNRDAMDFWQNHSVKFLEMVFRSDRRETLEKPDGYGRRGREECGDEIELFLTVRHGVISSASFETNGCIFTVACANAVVHLVEGKRLDEAWKITPEQVADYLETLPKPEMHCAQLAVRTLHVALANAQENERHPWRKFYQSQ